MYKLVSSYRLEPTTINTLNLLIHNYSQDDIIYLRQNRSFDHARPGGPVAVQLEWGV